GSGPLACGMPIRPVNRSRPGFKFDPSQSLRMLTCDLYPKQTVAFYSTATESSPRALASGTLAIQMTPAGAPPTERAASDSFPPLRSSRPAQDQSDSF